MCVTPHEYYNKCYLKLHKIRQSQKNNKKYNKDYIGPLGILKTIRGTQG